MKVYRALNAVFAAALVLLLTMPPICRCAFLPNGLAGAVKCHCDKGDCRRGPCDKAGSAGEDRQAGRHAQQHTPLQHSPEGRNLPDCSRCPSLSAALQETVSQTAEVTVEARVVPVLSRLSWHGLMQLADSQWISVNNKAGFKPFPRDILHRKKSLLI